MCATLLSVACWSESIMGDGSFITCSSYRCLRLSILSVFTWRLLKRLTQLSPPPPSWLCPNSTNTFLKPKHMHTLPLPWSQLHVDTDELNINLLQVITRFPGTKRTRAGWRLQQSTRMHEIPRKRWLYFTYCVEQIWYANSYTTLSAFSAGD
jgi:hypothetical protein